MSDYIKHKEYKLPNGRTVTADFNELGHATITIQAMDALFDILNSSDVVEVVRCKDCKFIRCGGDERNGILYFCSQDCKAKKSSDFCNYGERADT